MSIVAGRIGWRLAGSLALGSLLSCAPALAQGRTPGGTGGDPVAHSPADSTRGDRKAFSFAPASIDRCDYFLVTEAGAKKVWMKVDDHMDEYIFTNSIGVMKNIDRRKAIGGSLDLHLALGAVKVAPTLRYRRWLNRSQSVELAVGYIFDDSPGLVGPIVDAKLHLNRLLYAQGGVCQFREWNRSYISYDLDRAGYNNGRKHFNAYVGAGFGGGGGMILWGAEAIGFALLVAALSGMS